jgi:hypothetical protein
MNTLISNPADCKVRGVIRVLQAENVRLSEIHRKLVAVYGENVMNRIIRENRHFTISELY